MRKWPSVASKRLHSMGHPNKGWEGGPDNNQRNIWRRQDLDRDVRGGHSRRAAALQRPRQGKAVGRSHRQRWRLCATRIQARSATYAPALTHNLRRCRIRGPQPHCATRQGTTKIHRSPPFTPTVPFIRRFLPAPLLPRRRSNAHSAGPYRALHSPPRFRPLEVFRRRPPAPDQGPRAAGI
jgi:hypothetical protein